MTREEAIELLCYGDWLNVISEHIGKQDTERIAKAMCIIGKALRPVSREQVGKVWRGKWELYGGGKNGRGGIWHCTRCEKNYPYKNDFCPHCGAPMTDEAVQMVMERLEALHGETD